MEKKPPSERKPRTPKTEGEERQSSKPAESKTYSHSSTRTTEAGTSYSKPSMSYSRSVSKDSTYAHKPSSGDGTRTNSGDGTRKPYTGASRFERKPSAPRFDGSQRKPVGGPSKFKKPVGKHGPKGSSGANMPAQVKELMKQHNLSARAAFRVSKNVWTIEQALADDAIRTERRRKAEEMCKQYPGINISLACYLLKSNITPEQFLEQRKNRIQKHFDRKIQQKHKMGEDESQKIAFETLAKFAEQKTELELARYGQQIQSGTLKEFTPYEFIFVTDGQDTEIHRLKLKYCYEKRYSEIIKKWVMVDKSILKRKLRPAYRPINRYVFPEGILQKNAEIMLALHEGEMIRGKVIWFTPYDILLQANKAEIWIFRHSIVECALIKKP